MDKDIDRTTKCLLYTEEKKNKISCVMKFDKHHLRESSLLVTTSFCSSIFGGCTDTIGNMVVIRCIFGGASAPLITPNE